MRKRWLKRLAKALLLLMTLLVAFLVFERVRGQLGLASYKKKLLAQGEKLSPRDFTKTFAEPDNGAPMAIAAIQRLVYGEILLQSYLPQRQVLASGRAIVGHREPEFVVSQLFHDSQLTAGLITSHWEQVVADLQKNAATFTEIRQALAKPILSNELDLSDWENTKFVHLPAAKSGAQWFGALIQNSLHHGNREGALEALLVQLRFLNLVAADHTLIAELVRMAIGALAQASTWEALQAEGWTDAELLNLQQAWVEERFVLPIAHSFKSEMVIYELWHNRMRASNQECFNAFYFQKFNRFDWETGTWTRRSLTAKERVEFFWKKHIYTRIWRFAWSYQAQTHGLTAIQALCEIGQSAAISQSNRALEQSVIAWTNRYCNGGFYDQFRRFDYNIEGLQKSLSRGMRGETDRSLTLCAIAWKGHFLRHGKYPASLEALVPEFLPAVPIDYMDGKPIKYQLGDADTFILYSVGEDGQDNGGDLSLPDGSRNRALWRRRDYVWPAPATTEEVEEYRREASRN